ncbi:MAG TPA: endonuclease, partial [Deltaproteobacteria bacterium]|nr:endonuclease [Deltaproteobacteria bacterium]
MRIMTFNLLFDSGGDEPFAWRNRRDVVVRVVRRHRPHILGTQEGMAHQLEFLSERLAPDYCMVAEGRTWDVTSQYPTLFYRVDALDLLEAGESWLSKTPTVHLSKDWDSGFPRMMNYGVFSERRSDKKFTALVTHLDHISDKARLEQAKLVGAWLVSRATPAVVMGDFNDEPGSAVYRALTGDYRLMTDSWQELSLTEN